MIYDDLGNILNQRYVWWQGNRKGQKDESGIPLVDVAYRRAKAIKAGKKAQDAGKKPKKMGKKAAQPPSRTEEMRELFQTDMSERRLKKNVQKHGKSKNSFKSKSRYDCTINVPRKIVAYFQRWYCICDASSWSLPVSPLPSPHNTPPSYLLKKWNKWKLTDVNEAFWYSDEDKWESSKFQV